MRSRTMRSCRNVVTVRLTSMVTRGFAGAFDLSATKAAAHGHISGQRPGVRQPATTRMFCRVRGGVQARFLEVAFIAATFAAPNTTSRFLSATSR